MKKLFRNILLWVYFKYYTIMTIVGIALRNTEHAILKADPNSIDESNKKITRKLHHNPLLEKFYAGQRDEKYVQDYYELLKKADEFMLNATNHQMAVAADKYGMSLGRKDQYGRTYDHIGFFMGGHKHAGKTMGEVLKLEMEERRTKDDDFELLFIFNNKPVEVGLSGIDGVVDQEFNVKHLARKSKTLKFPMEVVRKKETLNKIEQLSEFLHIKKIGLDHRQLEFFIPKKFKLSEHNKKSKIFKEVINIKEVYIKNDYGEIIGFSVKGFSKKIEIVQKRKDEFGNEIIDGYDVLKFHAIEMETVNFK